MGGKAQAFLFWSEIIIFGVPGCTMMHVNAISNNVTKQAEAEVVPSSSLVEIEIEVGVEVGVWVEVGVEVGVEVESYF